MLPALCLLSAVWHTPTTQATLYQRPDCWRRFLVLLVIDVIKPPGTYFNNWLQLSCRSSKFSSSFPATSVLLYALLDPIRELAKCFKYFSDKHCKQVATCSTFPSANDILRHSRSVILVQLSLADLESIYAALSLNFLLYHSRNVCNLRYTSYDSQIGQTSTFQKDRKTKNWVTILVRLGTWLML